MNVRVNTVVAVACFAVGAEARAQNAPPPPPGTNTWPCTIPQAVGKYANGDKQVTLRCPSTFTPVKGDGVTVTKK